MDSNTWETIEGGCLCGAVRYQITGAPDSVAYCHCRMCQRSSGAPVVPWATINKNHLKLIGSKEPARYKSSSQAERSHCPICGTQLFFEFTGEGVPEEIDVTTVSLDDPSKVLPTYHIWTSSQVKWMSIHDNLPRYEDDGHDFTPYNSKK